MKVSTDSVLLGAWAQLDKAQNLLDLGCGSGLLALMAAQRSNAQITAIDIDWDALKCAQANFDASPWRERLTLIGKSAQDFAQSKQRFDHIICNPPYFDNGLLSPDPKRAKARHTETLSFAELAQSLASSLATGGRASLIVPLDAESALLKECANVGLHPSRLVAVNSTPNKAPHRVLIELTSAPDHCQRGKLQVYDQQQNYTAEFAALTKSFYLKL